MIRKRYKLTIEAESDLEKIWNDGFDEWGEQQADVYIASMYSRFQWLEEYYHLGMKRNDIKIGYLSYFEGKHTVFYQLENHTIEIIAVIGQRMDPMRHLLNGLDKYKKQ